MKVTPNEVKAPARAAEILGRMGLELAFVEPDRDTGLLPINSFLMDLEEFVRPTAPPEIVAGLTAARGWLDQILDGSGKFTAPTIGDLNEWHRWMSSALDSWSRGTVVAAIPTAWSPVNERKERLAGPAKPSPSPAPKSASFTAADGDEPAIKLNLAVDSDLLREFHSESLELLQFIEQGVLVLEANPTDSETINSIFRAFHTFKGGAGLLGLGALRDLAHDLESLLDAVRRSDLKITSEIIDLILSGADGLKQFTRGIGIQLQGVKAGEPIVVPTRDIIRRVRAVLRGEPAPAEKPIPPALAPATLSAPKSVAVDEPVLMAAEAAPPTPEPTPPPKPPEGPSAPDKPRENSAAAEGATGFVKLDTRKLDTLVDLVGELVIAQSMVVQNPDVQRLPNRALARCLRQLSRVTTELQRNAMSLRMVPIRGAFQKMTRLVRDLAAQQHKQVQLILEGEETELDRNMVEQLADPLVHMIRNSVDHGLETPDDRQARGKPALGTIRLTASHMSGGIAIRIQDDGNGLNRERILAKALERNLVKPNTHLTDSEIFSLIFSPGFSTAEKVTDVSGRGVGMDVVRRNIEKLRGKIEIQSTAGRGTTLTLNLPLTLAIIDGMLVGVGEDRYIIPTLSVRESFRPRPGMVSTVHERGEVVSVRGRLTPLLRLGDYLGTPTRAVDPAEGIIVVVESGEAARGILVDELIGKQEVVIKSLGDTFKRQSLLAGAAILGDGRVGLILDVDSLVKCRPIES